MAIISRDRADVIAKAMKHWSEHPNASVIVKTEPNQVADYHRALEDFDVEVLGHDRADMGIAYARQSVHDTMRERTDAYVMADDDTIIRHGEAERLVEFLRLNRAMCVGGWMNVHNLWYRHLLGGRTEEGKVPSGWVIPHFGDKLFAVNVALLDAAGGYDTARVLGADDTAELNRISIANGYLWWVHSGVHLRELGRTHASGGIESAYPGKTRAQLRSEAQRYIYEKWGTRYVSSPAKKGWSTAMSDFIGDHIGEDAAEAYRTKRPYRWDDDALPHGRRPEGPPPRVIQEAMPGFD